MTDLEHQKTINETRRELARAYNAFFAGAQCLGQMLELEKKLIELLRGVR
jgi:hypothetical protein